MTQKVELSAQQIASAADAFAVDFDMGFGNVTDGVGKAATAFAPAFG
jgi:hypothetical protein